MTSRSQRPTLVWPSWLIVLIGAYLVVASLLLTGGLVGLLEGNMGGAGALVAVFGILAGLTFMRWPAFITLVLGMWLILAPFVLGTPENRLGVLGWSQIIAGVLVVALSGLTLFVKTGQVARPLAQQRGIDCEELAEC